MVIFCISIISTYTLGYGFAYGNTYVIGFNNYFSPFSLDPANEGREMHWCLLFAGTSMVS